MKDTWQFSATCPQCGGRLEPRANGVPTDLGTEVNASAQCTKKHCKRHWQIHLRLIPMSYSSHRQEQP